MPKKIKTTISLSDMRVECLKEAENRSCNILITGEKGTGKTTLAGTAPWPILLDSFDPGGDSVVEDKVKEGKLVFETFTNEDPEKPTEFARWRKTIEERKKSGIFNSIQTYVLDSLSFWQDAIMNMILKKAGIPGKAPRRNHDYVPHKTTARVELQKLLTLPCNIICIGHIQKYREEGQPSSYEFYTTGSNKLSIPALFDEHWNVEMKRSKGKSYPQVRLVPSGTKPSASRLRSKIPNQPDFVEADIEKIFSMANIPFKTGELIK